MKRWIAFTVLVLGLSVLTSGGVRPEGAEAYNRGVHQTITKYARQLWSNAEILQYKDWIDAGASNEDLKDHVWDYYGTNGECITITHFWDPDNGPGDIMHTAFCNGENAAWKAQILWGMALGEYHSGDKEQAYEYLGHIAHLLGDMTVPAHAHDDSHVYDDTFDDEYMNIGNTCDTDPGNECLSDDELNGLIAAGPVEIPDGPLLPLYWLFYTTAQIGGFYASDDVPGNTEDPNYDPPLVDSNAFEDIPEFNDPSKVDGCDWAEEGSLCKAYMEIIRRNSYFHSIPAVAALYKLFEETAKQQAELTVVIDSIQQLQGHGDDPDYFVRVGIGDFWFRNEGVQAEDTGYDPIYPGWAFARDVGDNGTALVQIELWDDDGGNDDHSDIYDDPDGEERSLWLTVDLAKCVAGEAGAVSGDLGGTCGVQLTSAGDDDDRSQIWFRILAPNVPPTAAAGPDQTVDEADLVTLNGSFTDPNAGDTHTFLWHLESSTNGQAVPDATTESLSFTPVDDGVYTFSFTVTDSHGAQGSDTVVVTAENVPPVVSIDSLTDETGAEIGVDVPVGLMGLEVHLAGSFTDAGIVDTHTASLDWGDGEVYTQADFDSFSDSLGWATGTLNATHIYADPGIHTITLNVTDDDAGVGTTTAQIEAVDAAGAIAAVVQNLTPLADARNIRDAIRILRAPQYPSPPLICSSGEPRTLRWVCGVKIWWALRKLEAAEAAAPGLDLTNDKGLLALAAKSVAVEAIEEAEALAVYPNVLQRIQQARDLVAQGDALLAAHDYVGAVGKDQLAIRKVPNIW